MIIKKSLTLLFLNLFLVAPSSQTAFFDKKIIDRLGLTKTRVDTIHTPRSITQIKKIVASSKKPIAVAGARFSQGGQISYPDGTIIDMTHINKIINLDKQQKIITVQAGATWSKIQKYIDKYNLSIASMQSYNNFTIGGSLSINAHGRDIEHCSLISTVRSIEIILADGSLVHASREKNQNLFYAAIGGYGLIGIITQVTLQLTDNVPLERKVTSCSIKNFTQIQKDILAAPSLVLYNSNLLPNDYEQCIITTWHKTTKPITSDRRLQKQYSPLYIINRTMEIMYRRIKTIKTIRPYYENLKNIKPMVVWRNHEQSYSTNQLAIKHHFPTTMTLQEYFIPTEHMDAFMKKMHTILRTYNPNILNISIRHVKPDHESLMSYAPQESVAFVLYINVLNTKKGIEYITEWSQALIEAALEYNGTFYLPYLQTATKKQFDMAYPKFKTLLEIKKQFDPHNKFRNLLFKKYAECE